MCEDHCIGDGGAHRQAMRIPDGNPRAEPALRLLPHPQRDVKADNAAFAGDSRAASLLAISPVPTPTSMTGPFAVGHGAIAAAVVSARA